MIKRIFLFSLVFSFFFIFYSYNAEADLIPITDDMIDSFQDIPDATGDPVGSTQLENPIGNDVTFEIVVKRVVQAILGLTGVLALIAFIYGGVLWMVSRGDTGMIQKGKTMMIWAVFGIVIIFSSYALIKFVFEALMGQTTPTP